MKSSKGPRRILMVLTTLGFILAIGVSTINMTGCDDGDSECLVWGENCTQQYKQDNYGTTSIQCCEGQCTDHGSGILTCGS